MPVMAAAGPSLHATNSPAVTASGRPAVAAVPSGSAGQVPWQQVFEQFFGAEASRVTQPGSRERLVSKVWDYARSKQLFRNENLCIFDQVLQSLFAPVAPGARYCQTNVPRKRFRKGRGASHWQFFFSGNPGTQGVFRKANGCRFSG